MGIPDIVILLLSYSFSGFLIHWMDNWLNLRLQLLFLLVPVLGIILLSLVDFNLPDKRLSIGLLSTPLFVVVAYNIFNFLSWKLHNREFRLKISKARNMKYFDPYGKNDMYKFSDTFFSILLIVFWMLWPVLYLLAAHALSP